MSLLLEIPAELESEIREAAQREGRDFESYIIEAASEKARREKAQEAARLARSDAALDEITRLTEDLGLYEHQK